MILPASLQEPHSAQGKQWRELENMREASLFSGEGSSDKKVSGKNLMFVIVPWGVSAGENSSVRVWGHCSPCGSGQDTVWSGGGEHEGLEGVLVAELAQVQSRSQTPFCPGSRTSGKPRHTFQKDESIIVYAGLSEWQTCISPARLAF